MSWGTEISNFFYPHILGNWNNGENRCNIFISKIKSLTQFIIMKHKKETHPNSRNLSSSCGGLVNLGHLEALAPKWPTHISDALTEVTHSQKWPTDRSDPLTKVTHSSGKNCDGVGRTKDGKQFSGRLMDHIRLFWMPTFAKTWFHGWIKL
jgi:hypothetical protein